MELISSHPIKKSDIGFHGNLFGGKLMSWIDAAGAVYAMQLCDSEKMVTISIDQCLFKNPAKEGQVIKIYGKIKDFGNTSITLSLEARSHNVITGHQDIILSTDIKFVNINEHGRSTPIPQTAKFRYEQGYMYTDKYSTEDQYE